MLPGLSPALQGAARCIQRSLQHSKVFPNEFQSLSMYSSSSHLLRGYLIPIINTIFIELSTTAYLSFSFSPRFFLKLNHLPTSCKRFQIITFPTTFSQVEVNQISLSNDQSSANSSNGNVLVLRYPSIRYPIFSYSQKRKTTR